MKIYYKVTKTNGDVVENVAEYRVPTALEAKLQFWNDIGKKVLFSNTEKVEIVKYTETRKVKKMVEREVTETDRYADNIHMTVHARTFTVAPARPKEFAIEVKANSFHDAIVDFWNIMHQPQTRWGKFNWNRTLGLTMTKVTINEEKEVEEEVEL